jgi:2-polyprenyl-3-methyl-5-hydroxy-6-metoxy-1,4-benzoquinol methylase
MSFNEADLYDIFETKNEILHSKINDFLCDFFFKRNMIDIIDFSCGTGAQSIRFSKAGFNVTAVDNSKELIEKAKEKSGNLNINYHTGNMCESYFGEFDACITILNTISILSKKDFEIALTNISNQLTKNGFFVFDCTNRQNLSYSFYKYKFIETASEIGTKKIVRFVKGNFNEETGIAKWDWEVFIQDGLAPLIEKKGAWVRQTYTAEETKRILTDHGFKILELTDRNLVPFDMNNSAAYLIIAQKEE